MCRSPTIYVGHQLPGLSKLAASDTYSQAEHPKRVSAHPLSLLHLPCPVSWWKACNHLWPSLAISDPLWCWHALAISSFVLPCFFREDPGRSQKRWSQEVRWGCKRRWDKKKESRKDKRGESHRSGMVRQHGEKRCGSERRRSEQRRSELLVRILFA